MAEIKKTDWDARKIGALWTHKTETNKFMSGEVKVGGQVVRIVIYKNRFKKTDGNPKAPDLIIYKSEERNGKSKEAPKKVNTEAEADDLI